jgi:hypothetical protein
MFRSEQIVFALYGNIKKINRSTDIANIENVDT